MIERNMKQYAREKGYTLQAYVESALLKQIEHDRALTSNPLYINN